MFIPLDRDTSFPLTRQISTYLEEMIRRGHLARGAVLPPTRTLARELQVNRKTVESAYEELRARRLVSMRAGYAPVVRTTIPDNPELDLPFRRPRGRDPFPAEAWCASPEAAAERRDLAGSSPRPWNLSPAALRRLHREAIERPGPLFTPPPPLGEGALRRAASAHLARCGILRAPDEIAILPDRETALRRVLELFVPPRGRVLGEALLDPELVRAVRAHPARLRRLGDPARWGRELAREPRLLLVATGATRLPGEPPPLERRKALLDLARERALPVVEDVTGVDRHEGAPPPPLANLDSTGRVIALCDLSDEVGGRVTATAVAATSKVIERLRLASPDAATPDRLAQRVLALALESPRRARALRAVRERRELVKAAVRRVLPRRLPEVTGTEFSSASEAVRLDLPDGITGEALRIAAAARGVDVHSARDCGADARGDSFVLLDLTRHAEGELLQAIRALGAAFDDVEERRSAS